MCSRGARSSARRVVLDAMRSMFRRDQYALVRPVDLVVYAIGWMAVVYLLLVVAFGAMGVL